MKQITVTNAFHIHKLKISVENKIKVDGSTGHGDFALSKETRQLWTLFATTKPKLNAPCFVIITQKKS